MNRAANKIRISKALNAGHSVQAAGALNHVLRMEEVSHKFDQLNKMQAQGQISVSEKGKAAQKLQQSLNRSMSDVSNALGNYENSIANMRVKQNQHLNILDDSACVLMAQAYKANKDPAKIKQLNDPRLLGALAKAGEFISGLSDESLSNATESYFTNHPDFAEGMQQIASDKAILQSIGKDIESSKVSGKLNEAIAEGEAIGSMIEL